MSSNSTVKKLSDDQVEAFDTDFVDGKRWEAVNDAIQRQFPDGQFSMLDVGGGNGRFADRVLSQYPNSTACVLDNSSLLLSRNSPNPRKECILGSTDSLHQVERKFDLICMHWVLHHLVGTSYASTRAHQQQAIVNSARLLTPRGRISVYENNVSSWLFDALPGWLIFQISAAKLIAGLTRRFGANTGGVGVCYLTREQWSTTFLKSGLGIDRYTAPDNWDWPIPAAQRILLTLNKIEVGHYWLRADGRHQNDPGENQQQLDNR